MCMCVHTKGRGHINCHSPDSVHLALKMELSKQVRLAGLVNPKVAACLHLLNTEVVIYMCHPAQLFYVGSRD